MKGYIKICAGHFYRFVILFALNFSVHLVYAQHYNAIHGSNHSGALGVYNNPSSIVTSPYKWDLTIFGTQFQNITDAVTGKNFPLYLSPSSKFKVAEGNFPRKADLISNIRLLNGRYSISRTKAIAFGVNIKTYTQAQTSRVNYNDSVEGARTFLFYNEQNRVLSADMTSSAWAELYLSYAFTLWDQESSRLNVGATLKGLRGMSGLFAEVNNVQIERDALQPDIVTNILQGSAKYGYSTTHGADLKTFDPVQLFRTSQGGLAVDVGVEYLVKTQAVTTVFDEDDYYDYEWKIGVSLLDLGWNRFLYGHQSRSVSSLKTDISGETLQQKFTSLSDVGSFTDSLETIVDQYSPLSGEFNIINPARAVINVDKYMWGNFYINGELSINLTQGTKDMRAVRESKLLTITPRWEDRKFGFYFPLQVTRYGNFWIGGAIKAGPLLFGTHNLLNAFLGNKKLGGGAYLALTLRPSDFMSGSSDKRNNCPSY